MRNRANIAERFDKYHVTEESPAIRPGKPTIMRSDMDVRMITLFIVFSGDGVWICLPAIGDALGAAGCAGESMVIPVASSPPREKPQVEPSGVQAASRSYR